MAMLVTMVGCSGSGSGSDEPRNTFDRTDASQAFRSIGTALQDIAKEAPTRTAHAPYGGVARCPQGGTVNVEGSADANGQDLEVHATYAGCTASDLTVDGELSINLTFDEEAGTGTMDVLGELAFRGPISGHCTLDFAMIISSGSSVRYAGTMCGFDVGELAT